jgi:hypothetical protein
VTIWLLGILSVMIISSFALSRRLSSHSTLISKSERSRVARNVLEGYSGDVWRHLRLEANRKDSPFYKTLRSIGPTAGSWLLSSEETGYAPTALVGELESLYRNDQRYELSLVIPPKMTIEKIRPLPLPEMLYWIDPDKAVHEWEAVLCISTTVTSGEQTYRLDATHRLRMVSILMPFLREFAWFFDQMHLGQRPDEYADDQINVLHTGDDFPDEDNYPLVLEHFSRNTTGDGGGIDTERRTLGDPHENGKVFFGADDQPIFLNLTGEANPHRNLISDLWMLKPSHFGIQLPQGDSLNLLPLNFVGINSAIRGFKKDFGPPESPDSLFTQHYLMGFSEELAKTEAKEGVFARFWALKDFLAQDPGYQALSGNPQQFSRSSGLKPLGLSRDPQLCKLAVEMNKPIGDFLGGAPVPDRWIFGKVFRRFLMLSLFSVPSSLEPFGKKMEYSPSPSFTVEAEYLDGRRERFSPPSENTYQDFMSKVVSGSTTGAGDVVARALWQPFNLQGGRNEKTLDHKDFEGVGGLRVTPSAGFSQFRQQFLTFTRTTEVSTDPGKPGSTLADRMRRYFPNVEAFLKEACGRTDLNSNEGKFWVAGTVFLDAGLNLPNGIGAGDIRGGIVVVNGPLTLGNVVPGSVKGLIPDSLNPNDIEKILEQVSDKLPPEELLTFVVLNGHPITLTGTKYTGVQIISLHDGPTPLEPPAEPFFFFGGLALSRPDIPYLIKRVKRGSVFYFPPAFAVETPPRAADIEENLTTYAFSLE